MKTTYIDSSRKTFITAILMTIISLNVNAFDITELKLPNSNKIVLKFMFRNGSICDPIGKEGLTYTTAKMITEGGTEGMTSSQIKEKLYPMASNYYCTVDKEVTVFTFEVHRDFLAEFYKIAKGLISNPSFLVEDFSRVISAQQNYVDKVIRSSSDEEYSKKALEDYLFRGTSYQWMVQGKSASVKNISLDDVKAHYKQFFSAANLNIGIAGNYTADFVATLINDMKQLSPTVQPIIPAAPRVKMQEGVNIEIISKANALGSAIFTGFPIVLNRSGDDFAALMVANSWLGEHRKSYSLLYQKIREARSMNYGDYSYIEWYESGGQNMLPVPGVPRISNYCSIWLRPVQTAKGLKGQYPELSSINLGHAYFALKMAIREMDNMIQQGMTEEQFSTTRDFLRSYMKLYVQTPAKRLGFLMDSKFYGRKDYIAEMDILLEKLTLADVNNAIKKYWQVQNMCVAIVTDDSEATELVKSLKTNADAPMSYSNSLKEVLPKSVLAEDEEVAKYKLNVRNVNIVKSEDTFR